MTDWLTNITSRASCDAKNPFYEKTKRKACNELIGIRITQLRWTSQSLSKFIETPAWILLFSDFWKSELKDKPTALKINDAHIYFIVSCFMSRHLYRNWKGKQWISLDSEDAFTRTRFFLSLWLPLSQSAEKTQWENTTVAPPILHPLAFLHRSQDFNF